MKVRRSEGTKCFIAILNRSDSALPEAVLNATATVSALCVAGQSIPRPDYTRSIIWPRVWVRARVRVRVSVGRPDYTRG